MKRVLNTGKNSYIGTSFECYVRKLPSEYIVDTVDMVDGSWRQKSFGGYDAVFHVAGIAHSDLSDISEERRTLYYKVNTELAIEVAKKARAESVRQFIFMSSIVVYGDSAPIGKQKIITRDTLPAPSNCYGDSKLRAEKGILPLANDKFTVCVLRSPMIYGRGCKGNFPVLEKYACRLRAFPYVDNQRSMLYIDNLCTFVRLMIDNLEGGIFYPQNVEYTQTSEMVRKIAKAHGKKIVMVKGVSWLIRPLKYTKFAKKVFGNLVYDKEMSMYSTKYCLVGFDESIALSRHEDD